MTQPCSPELHGPQAAFTSYDPQYGPMPPSAPQSPEQHMPPPPPIRPNRTPLIVLAVLFIIALATASTMLVRYLDERSTNVSLTRQLDDRQRSLTDANLKLTAANAHIDQLNTQTNNLNSQVTNLTTSNSSLNKCVTAFKTWVVTSDANPGANNLDQLASDADSACGF